MGGRFPMAGQTTSSWPSAKTLQSTKTWYSQQAWAIMRARFTILTFFLVLKLCLWAAQNSMLHYLSHNFCCGLTLNYRFNQDTALLCLYLGKNGDYFLSHKYLATHHFLKVTYLIGPDQFKLFSPRMFFKMSLMHSSVFPASNWKCR